MGTARDETMGFNSSAVIAGVLGSLLVVGIVLVVTNSNDVNAPAEAQQTELMWGDNSAPLGLVDGWNTSVGTAAEREAAARHFHVTIADDDSLWKHNVFTPFAGKTLKMVGIKILKRNAFNTLIEYKVKQGNVAWTVEPGPHGVWGPMVERIDGKYTGTSRNAGYASPSEWIESDYKVFLGHKIENDWGLVNATSWDKTTVVMDYQSYQKGHFIMTWQLPQEGEVEPTELSSSRPASCSKCSPIIDPTGAGSTTKECGFQSTSTSRESMFRMMIRLKQMGFAWTVLTRRSTINAKPRAAQSDPRPRHQNTPPALPITSMASKIARSAANMGRSALTKNALTASPKRMMIYAVTMGADLTVAGVYPAARGPR